MKNMKNSCRSYGTYLRRRKFTGCSYLYWTPDEYHVSVFNYDSKLLGDWMLGNGLNSLHLHLAVMHTPMAERVVIVLELQRRVRIGTSFDSIWIIDGMILLQYLSEIALFEIFCLDFDILYNLNDTVLLMRDDQI